MAWMKIEGDALQRLKNRFELPPPSTIVEAASMQTPFYNNGELVKISDGQDTGFMVAAGQGDISARTYYPLRGPGADIHTANEAAGLVITPDNVNEYLRFFMTFLRTGEGESLAIIETLNGFGLVNKDKPGQRKPEDMRLVCEAPTPKANYSASEATWSIRASYSGFRCSSARTDSSRCSTMIGWDLSSVFTDPNASSRQSPRQSHSTAGRPEGASLRVSGGIHRRSGRPLEDALDPVTLPTAQAGRLPFKTSLSALR